MAGFVFDIKMIWVWTIWDMGERLGAVCKLVIFFYIPAFSPSNVIHCRKLKKRDKSLTLITITYLSTKKSTLSLILCPYVTLP